ncbi:hypothetical protein OAO87_00960 [bacterium]|nr:hypothetical protein [bacterium]
MHAQPSLVCAPAGTRRHATMPLPTHQLPTKAQRERRGGKWWTEKWVTSTAAPPVT